MRIHAMRRDVMVVKRANSNATRVDVHDVVGGRAEMLDGIRQANGRSSLAQQWVQPHIERDGAISAPALAIVFVPMVAAMGSEDFGHGRDERAHNCWVVHGF